jgi:hypothetical protein
VISSANLPHEATKIHEEHDTFLRRYNRSSRLIFSTSVVRFKFNSFAA